MRSSLHRLVVAFCCIISISLLTQVQAENGPAGSWYSKLTSTPSAKFEIRAARQEELEGYESRKTKDGGELFVATSVAISNSDVERARVVLYQKEGKPAFEVELELSITGGEKIAQLTKDCIGEQIALLVDGIVFAAPFVSSTVSSRNLKLAGFEFEADADRIAKGIVAVKEGNQQFERTAKAPAH